MSQHSKKIYIILLALFTFACIPTLAPTSEPLPTFDANAPLTAIVETFSVAATQTQKSAPPTLTSTVTPTRTAIPTETASPTFVFLLPTSTVPPTQIPAGSSGKELECQILSQEPPNNTMFSPQAAFTTTWIIANVGLKTWPSDNADYRYSSGDKIHLQAIYDFEKNVIAGDTVALTVAMQAPNQLGNYSTIWQISIGKERFCSMQVIIRVN